MLMFLCCSSSYSSCLSSYCWRAIQSFNSLLKYLLLVLHTSLRSHVFSTAINSLAVPPEMSDSDSTIDSDELEEAIAASKVKKHLPANESSYSDRKPGVRELFGLSDSDAEGSSDGEKDLFPSDDQESVVEDQDNDLPKCKYWEKCYRKNPDHLKMFSHPQEAKTSKSDSPERKKKKIQPSGKNTKENNLATKARTNCFNFFLTKVNGIPWKFNKDISCDIKDILSTSQGKLKSSAQFNYMFDIPWLMKQYPEESRKCPLTIVHGEQRESKKALEKSGEGYSNITFCQAKLPIPFGTHHTMWLSPLFEPLKTGPSLSHGESVTGFKSDLIEYISSYAAKELEEWCSIIKKHDMSKARVYIVGSVPGRHVGSRKTSFGHLKMRKVLNLNGPLQGHVGSDWSVVGQFSSIGSLGASPDQWLTGEFVASLSTVRSSSPMSSPTLKLVYPSVDNVRTSLEGYPAGASLPYSVKVAMKQRYLKSFLHQWKSERIGRSVASPHIKTYMRLSEDNAKIAWFLVTSANLSKAAWGSFEKNNTQFMIRSYELGVLFMPQHYGDKEFFSTSGVEMGGFPIPYDVPLKKYNEKDMPWIWDIPHIRLPDRNGNMWCPP